MRVGFLAVREEVTNEERKKARVNPEEAFD